MPRDPDFLIIGAMKAGTTSLFRWLGRLDDVALPAMKEIEFFGNDDRWDQGLAWYRSFFEDDARLTGEASPSYTEPTRAARAAERILQSVPDARLIFLARHPLERSRSHYRHWVQRGSENRPFPEAATVDSNYITRSMYWQSVQPYIERFPADQLLIVRFEDLIEDRGGWEAILAHLRLPDYPRPTDNQNPTAGRRRNSRLHVVLGRTGALKLATKLPKSVRAVGAKVLTSDSQRYRDLVTSSQAAVADNVEETLWADISQLESHLGTTLWSR